MNPTRKKAFFLLSVWACNHKETRHQTSAASGAKTQSHNAMQHQRLCSTSAHAQPRKDKKETTIKMVFSFPPEERVPFSHPRKDDGARVAMARAPSQRLSMRAMGQHNNQKGAIGTKERQERAMTTCHPDNAFTSIKLSQSNSAPAKHHYHKLKHAIRYLNTTQTDGIYFWRTSPCLDLPEGPLPPVNSNNKDLLLDDCPDHDASIAVAYGDLDWATCVKRRQSFSGICVQLAGGTIAYKTKFQPTVVLSSTEGEFMAACDVG